MGEDAKKICPNCESPMQQTEVPEDILCFTVRNIKSVGNALRNMRMILWD